jgi:hypothetical protein
MELFHSQNLEQTHSTLAAPKPNTTLVEVCKKGATQRENNSTALPGPRSKMTLLPSWLDVQLAMDLNRAAAFGQRDERLDLKEDQMRTHAPDSIASSPLLIWLCLYPVHPLGVCLVEWMKRDWTGSSHFL